MCVFRSVACNATSAVPMSKKNSLGSTPEDAVDHQQHHHTRGKVAVDETSLPKNPSFVLENKWRGLKKHRKSWGLPNMKLASDFFFLQQ